MNVKLNDGVSIPALGFGVFQVPNNGPTYEAVKIALKIGYRHIDTAAAYMNESDVGKAVKDSGIAREDIFITSKLWLQDYGYDSAVKAIDTSLKYLGMDYMDMYLLHQPYGDTLNSWKALENAKKAGKIKSIGISNFSPNFYKKFVTQIETLPSVNQMECNPFFQQRELRELMDKDNVKLQAWYPLGHGNKKLLQHEKFVSLAGKYNKTASQIILRFEIQDGLITLPKSTNPAHIEENFNIFDFELTEDEMKEIRAIDTGIGTHNPDDLSRAEDLLSRYKIHD